MSFSQQINTLEELTSVSDNTNILVSNLQDGAVLNSARMEVSIIRDDGLSAIKKIPEFNPTGTWNFTKGITIPDRTFNIALRNDLSSTLIPKSYLENDFMNLLNDLSSDIYNTPHIPSAVGEIIFSTYCKTEAKVKKYYGDYTAWRQIPGRFLLATSNSNGKLKKPEQRGGEATHTPTIDEIPMHEHIFECSDETTTLELEKTANIMEDSVENVLTLDKGSGPQIDHSNSGSEARSAATNNKITVAYSIKSGVFFYGDGSSEGATIKESTLKNKPHSNMPPFYAVYIWERIK